MWRRSLSSRPLTSNVRTTTTARRRIVSSSTAKTVFSGIQPTGIPHLGNYLGAISQWVQLQKHSPATDRLYFAIVDLHSLTSRSLTPADRSLYRRQALAMLLAAGLDPARCVLFHQSSVPQHAELHWILSCDAGVGALARMPTWKEKMLDSQPSAVSEDPSKDAEELLLRGGKENEERLKLGLFSYPVLQAADILLYDTTHVPVGSDQLVHIEFARSAANTFNHLYGAKGKKLLVSPEAVVGPARRIMSLTEPNKKMSKSATNPKSRILVTDSESEIRKTLRSALTDDQRHVSYDPDTRPGVSNLLEMIALLESKADGADKTPDEVAADFQAMSVTGSIMRVLKDRAADLVDAELAPVRELFKTFMDAPVRLDEVAQQGRKSATQDAEKTMQRVREAIGLY